MIVRYWFVAVLALVAALLMLAAINAINSDGVDADTCRYIHWRGEQCEALRWSR